MSFFKSNNDDTDFAAQYGREVLFEVVFIGNAVKVTAIDAETGVEASIIGAPTMTQYTLKMNAMRKLINVLSKMERAELDVGDDSAAPPPRARRPGWYA